jgi:hypothetical protein
VNLLSLRLTYSFGSSDHKWVVVLAATTAALYYLPAVFLQQLTQYLQDNPDRKNIRYGWVMCFGLAASNIVMFLAVGILWYVLLRYI